MQGASAARITLTLEIMMADSWCEKTKAKNGRVVYGGAARNVRIANAGGMDQILADVAAHAATSAVRNTAALYGVQAPKTLRPVTRGRGNATFLV